MGLQRKERPRLSQQFRQGALILLQARVRCEAFLLERYADYSLQGILQLHFQYKKVSQLPYCQF
jgi:hypothetical protein